MNKWSRSGKWSSHAGPEYCLVGDYEGMPVLVAGRWGNARSKTGWRKVRYYTAYCITQGCRAEAIGSARDLKQAKALAERFVKTGLPL